MASGSLPVPVIVKKINVTLESSSSVTPFGAYAHPTGTEISGYMAIAAAVRGGATAPILCRVAGPSGTLRVYGPASLAGQSYDIDILYVRI